MRVLVLVLMLSACSDDGGSIGIHAITTCDDVWVRNGYTECEHACMSSTIALGASGPACEARTSMGPVSCSKTFVFDGVTGCCASNPPKQLFGECN